MQKSRNETKAMSTKDMSTRSLADKIAESEKLFGGNTAPVMDPAKLVSCYLLSLFWRKHGARDGSCKAGIMLFVAVVVVA